MDRPDAPIPGTDDSMSDGLIVSTSPSGAPTLRQERHRPGFHFTAPENWINDPNGLLYYGGSYHLFYQYNPYDKVWGSMHWGHAVGEDLLHWRHRPVALHADPDNLGFVFSGSAVVDWHNTTGLKNGEHPPLVAVFSHHSKHDVQVQSLAYSIDGGDTWRMYPGNPVIPNPGLADFRDPKVFWDARFGHWVMALAGGDAVKFYTSPNLIDWRHVSDFGRRLAPNSGTWECPDLFELAVGATGESRWVLLVSVNPGAPNGGSATGYFVGVFDGVAFRPEHDGFFWLDYGPDNYATHTWSDLPASDGRRLAIGWMNNWDYANNLPTAPWRGAMTVPRELGLVETAAGTRLGARPIRELQNLRRRTICEATGVAVRGRFEPAFGDALPEKLDAEIELQGIEARSSWTIGFFNRDGEALLLEIADGGRCLRADRGRAAQGMEDRHGFVREITAPLDTACRGGVVALRILKDTSSVEVFAMDGPSLLTLTYFVGRPLDRLVIESGGLGAADLRLYELAGIWERS